MASKEATVFIVDVGATMGETSHGRTQTNLDWALEYVWDRITTVIATGRKTNMVGVVGLRTDGTHNVLQSEEDYQHISVLQPIAQILMPQVRKLREDLIVSKTNFGDATSAIIIAIQMIAEQCKKLQYIRRIVLVTDARAHMHTDDLAEIRKKIQQDHIELTVLGVDFDDAEYGFKEEAKDATKATNEEILRSLCDDCGGAFGTLAQAIEESAIPRVKSTKPVPTFRGYLTLGNPQDYDTAMTIDVERYPKIMVARAPTASSLVVRNGLSAADATQSSATMSHGDGEEGGPPGDADGNNLTGVRSARTYQINDEEAPGGKRDVPFEELAKGYEYGRTAVHISESDRNVTTYETQPGLDLMGFVDKQQYEKYLDMSRASLIVSQKLNDKASMALSSFIHALYELDSYAVARLVVKENKEPRIVLLTPHIEPDFECLYDVELPFAEDMRNYRFPPLDRVVTVSGKEIKVHRNLPNDELVDAMSAYVDQMDLSSFGRDDDGEPTEYMPPDETYSPMLHVLNRVIKHRAVFPDADPPPPYDVLLKYSQPPAELMDAAKPALARVIKAADVKKVPPKARGKRFSKKDTTKPLSDLDVGALLAQDPARQKKRIDPQNAVAEFKQALAAAASIEELHEACSQLKFIIFDWIRHSIGESGYGRAVEAIRVMREEMNELEEPQPYNSFLRELKQKVLGGELGGDRKEMWYRVRVNRLALIQKAECQASEVTAEEARQFMIPQQRLSAS